jgi:methyl-accepting chemotaxis protein
MFSNLRISTRLYLLVVLMAIIAVVAGIFGIVGMSGTLASLKSVYQDRTVPAIHLSDIRRNFVRVQVELLLALQHAPGTEVVKLHDHAVDVHLGTLEKYRKEIDTAWQEYQVSKLAPEEKEFATDFARRYQTYISDYVVPASAAFRSGDFSTATVARFLKQRLTHAVPTSESLQKLVDIQEKLAKAEFDHAVASYERTRAWSIGLITGGLLLSALMAWLIIRSVSVPLASMRDAIVHADRNRDFTRRAPVGGSDEVGATAAAFNGLMETLQGTFGELRGSIAQLSRDAQSLSSASQQAAAGSSDSSDAASSMAASVEQMTVSVAQISDNAREAAGISNASGREAESGARIIRDTAGEIQNIAASVNHGASIITDLGEQSGRISSIVRVIGEVANQTNLLALNAAIEAARAGEQGRGFAVVADEVRKLAERTSAATAEIAAMVEAIQKSADEAVTAMNTAVGKVDAGVSLAKGAEDAIASIRGGVDRVVHVVSDMSAALAEQSSASNSIAQQVERVAQAADESSSAAQSTSESARGLEKLAAQMDQSLARFTV